MNLVVIWVSSFRRTWSSSQHPRQHLKGNTVRCRPRFPQGQEELTNAQCSAIRIKPQSSPGHIHQIMQRGQDMAVFTMAHSYRKSRKSLPMEISTCWPRRHSKKSEPSLPRGLWQESSQSSASKLSSMPCVLSKNFHTESSIPITPQDSIKMIGKNRPGFLAWQPKYTVPQGESGLTGISRDCDVFLESSWGQRKQCHQMAPPRKHWGDAQECLLWHGLSLEGRDGSTSSWCLG